MLISANDGEIFPKLGLAKQTRDALARYVQMRWPVGTRKAVAQEFGLSIEAARSVCEGTPSAATIDQIWKSPKGGWAVLLPVMGAVVGESLDQHIQKQREDHAQQDRRRDALLRDLRTGHDARPVAGY